MRMSAAGFIAVTFSKWQSPARVPILASDLQDCQLLCQPLLEIPSEVASHGVASDVLSSPYVASDPATPWIDVASDSSVSPAMSPHALLPATLPATYR